MKIDFNRILTDLEGKEMKNENGIVTLKVVAVNSMAGNYPDEKTLEGKEKLERWELIQKIQHSTEPLELTTEEVSKIKKMIGKGYSTIVSGQSWQMIEGNNA